MPDIFTDNRQELNDKFRFSGIERKCRFELHPHVWSTCAQPIHLFRKARGYKAPTFGTIC